MQLRWPFQRVGALDPYPFPDPKTCLWRRRKKRFASRHIFLRIRGPLPQKSTNSRDYAVSPLFVEFDMLLLYWYVRGYPPLGRVRALLFIFDASKHAMGYKSLFLRLYALFRTPRRP
jgi:hypothetical protein